MEWPECFETNRNLTQGGRGGITVPNCMLVRDIPAVPARMKRNQ